MPITLTLNNFRCWENKTFSFSDNGIILLSGISGKGKSTILNAILYVITGNLKNVATFGKEKHKLEVILAIDDLVITRGKNPTRFIVKKGLKIYEDHEAQTILDQQFGVDFKHISYIDQDNTYSFVYLTPEAKMSFLRNLLLVDEQIDGMKDTIKKELDASKNQLLSHDSIISVITPLFEALTFTTNVCKVKRVITIDNYQETLNAQTTNLDISKKNKVKLLSKLSKAETDQKKYNEQLFNEKQKSEMETELGKYDMNQLKKTLSELQQQKTLYDQQQLFVEKHKKYNSNLAEKERLQIPNSDFSMIPLLEKIIATSQTISNLEEKIGEDKEEKLNETKTSLTTEIKQMNIILEQQNTYECPSCETHLKLCQGKLIKVNILPVENICVSMEEILKKQKLLDRTQKDLTLLEKMTEEYNILFDEFDSLLQKSSLTSETNFNEMLATLKKEERVYNINTAKLNEINKWIEEYESSTHTHIDLSMDIYSIIEQITTVKESIKRYNVLQEKLLSLQFESLMNQNDLIQETKDQISSYEEKIDTYETSIKQLHSWKQTHDTNQKYIEFSEKIKASKDAKEYLMEKVKCYEKLLYYIKEAETRSIFDFIETLNQHASFYIEDFFPDEDIRVQLVTNKELKSGKEKIGLFFEVNYHAIKGEIDFLSGGQRDRVNLAFTLALSELVQNRILLLDECISSLDSDTSDTVIETLKEKYKGKLIVCVAHQVNTGSFDQIVAI